MSIIATIARRVLEVKKVDESQQIVHAHRSRRYLLIVGTGRVKAQALEGAQAVAATRVSEARDNFR